MLDSDNVGKDYQKQLAKERYRDEKGKVLGVADFLGDKEYEIEDLIPVSSFISIIDRQYRSDQYFEDYHKKDEPIVNQIEAWATKKQYRAWKRLESRNCENYPISFLKK